MARICCLLVCLGTFAALAACGPEHDNPRTASPPVDGGLDASVPDAAIPDASVPDAAVPDAAVPDAAIPDASVPDAAIPDASVPDAAIPDASVPDAAIPDASIPDAAIPDALVLPDAPAGVLTGGPCMSGRPGVTAYRVRWAGSGSGGPAYPVYEVNGLPDQSRDHVGVYGYQIGYTPQFEDVFLAQGGLRLDGGSFVDIKLTTVGLATISNATLSIYGRSYATTSSGSFNWQTFEGTGAAPTNLVSNSAPYQWYSADMTTEISAGNNGVFLRIKAGPSSGALIVNRIEICMTAT